MSFLANLLYLGILIFPVTFVATVLFYFSRKRHGTARILAALAIGVSVGVSVGLIYFTWQWLEGTQQPFPMNLRTIEVVVEFWQNAPTGHYHWLAISAILCIFASWLSLVYISPYVMSRPKPADDQDARMTR